MHLMKRENYATLVITAHNFGQLTQKTLEAWKLAAKVTKAKTLHNFDSLSWGKEIKSDTGRHSQFLFLLIGSGFQGVF